MSGIDYKKVAKLSEGKGNFKKAADYYAGAGDFKKAYELYQKILSETNDRTLIKDIRMRLTRLNPPKNLVRMVQEADKRILEGRIYAAASIICLIGSLFFVSFNLTGNSIGDLNKGDFSLLGIGLFVIGLMAFILFKSKKKFLNIY